MRDRLVKLKKLFKDKTENFLFLDYDDPHHFWLLGKKLENSYILIRRTGKPILLINPLTKFKDDGFIIKPFEKENLPSKVLVNKNYFKAKYDNLFNIKEIELDVRSVKSQKEIIFTKKACTLTDKCFDMIVDKLKSKKYVREKDIEKDIKLFAAKNDLKIAFEPVIASGKNSSVPHHDNSSRLKKGFLIIDFGFKYKGYSSDMTRTLFIGKPTKKDKEKYAKVLEAQEEIISKITIDVSIKSLYETLEEKLPDYKEKMLHKLGHGVGIEVHEAPNFSNEDLKLKKNQIIAIEPAIYEKQGIRIEDTILVDKKPILLTKSTKDLIITNL